MMQLDQQLKDTDKPADKDIASIYKWC